MTTKTAAKPSSRIDELADQIAAHLAALGAIESQAAMLDAQAASAEDRAVATLSNFKRPAEGLASDVQALRGTARSFRDGAELLRQRAVAYRAEYQVGELEDEHRGLVAEEIARSKAERDAERIAALTAEFETRVAQLGEHLLAVEAIEWRMNWLVDQGVSTPRAFAATNDARAAARWAAKMATTDAHRREFMDRHLPKLDS